MKQKPFGRNKNSRANVYLTLASVAIIHTICAPVFSQSPGFVSYISDTQFGSCIANSPDGSHVYAAGPNTLAVFKRNDDGTFTPIQTINNDYKNVKDLRHVIALAVSPDGEYVYAISLVNQTISTFSRDRVSGEVRLLESFRDSAFVTVPSLRQAPERLLFSPQGDYLYWLFSPNPHYPDNRIVIFAREHQTGRLNKITTIKNDDEKLGRYNVPNDFAFSHNGKHLYGIGYNGTKLLMLTRDSSNGLLFFNAVYETEPSPDGDWYDGSVALSADGTSLYATYADILEYGRVFVFDRNPPNGELTKTKTFSHPNPYVAWVAPDSRHLYVDIAGGKIAIYSRDSLTGETSFSEEFSCGCGPGSPSGIVASPDAKNFFLSNGHVLERETTSGRLCLIQSHTNNSIGGTDRLDGSRAVGISHEGSTLFVAANHYGDGGITAFSRDQDAGQITQSKFYPMPHLATMFASPDGQFLYAVNDALNKSDTTLEVFRYDALSQNLLPVQKIFGTGTFPAFSPNGEHLYLSSQSELLIYARDPLSGKLDFVQKIVAWDLDMAERFSVAVSPDGRYLYWVGHYYLLYFGCEVGIFKRNPQSGELTLLKRQRFAQMHPGWGLKFSSDGKFVYAGTLAQNPYNYTGELLATFSRDVTTGDLTLLEIFRRGAYEICNDLEMSADGKEVYAFFNGEYYAITNGGTMLAMFDRSPETGKLTLRYTYPNNDEEVLFGGDIFSDLALSPDGAFVYVTNSRGVATFSTGRGRPVGVAEHNPFLNVLPRTLKLEQNYPNPFSTSTAHASQGMTAIHYEITGANKSIPVELAIYNTQGQLVNTLVNEAITSGKHSVTWNSANAQGQLVPSGVYFYRLKMAEQIVTKKMLLVR